MIEARNETIPIQLRRGIEREFIRDRHHIFWLDHRNQLRVAGCFIDHGHRNARIDIEDTWSDVWTGDR